MQFKRDSSGVKREGTRAAPEQHEILSCKLRHEPKPAQRPVDGHTRQVAHSQLKRSAFACWCCLVGAGAEPPRAV